MPLSLFEIYGALPAFVLVLFRVSGLVFAVPLFSSAAVPMRIKALLSVAMAAAVFPMLAGHVPTQVTLASGLIGLIGEVAIGLFIGLGVTWIFVGVQLAAQLIGQQSGMRLGSVYNPMLESQSTLASQLYYLVALMVFLAAGGDHAVMRVLLDSFAALPPLTFSLTPDLVDVMIDIIALSFVVAIRVGGPTILALLLAFLTLGFLTRTVPQLNILTVGFPVKLAVGLFMMAMTMITLEPVLLEALTECVDGVRAGLGMPPAP